MYIDAWNKITAHTLFFSFAKLFESKLQTCCPFTLKCFFECFLGARPSTYMTAVCFSNVGISLRYCTVICLGLLLHILPVVPMLSFIALLFFQPRFTLQLPWLFGHLYSGIFPQSYLICLRDGGFLQSIDQSFYRISINSNLSVCLPHDLTHGTFLAEI